MRCDFAYISTYPQSYSENLLSLLKMPVTGAELLKNLNHPRIPLIYDIDENRDYIYMIKAFIQDESLDTHVFHQQSISQEPMSKIGIQLCEFFDYPHQLLHTLSCIRTLNRSLIYYVEIKRKLSALD